MYKKCQSEQADLRQRRLEQGLLDIMGRKAYDEISVSDLCAEMGVPRKTFYRYFSGKDGALHALIDHVLMDFDAKVGIESARGQHENAVQYMEQVFQYWVDNQPLLDALARNNLNGVLVQRAVEYTKEFDTLPAFFQSASQQLRNYATMFSVCGLMTMLIQWHQDGFSESVEQMAQLAIHLFSQPLFSVET